MHKAQLNPSVLHECSRVSQLAQLKHHAQHESADETPYSTQPDYLSQLPSSTQCLSNRTQLSPVRSDHAVIPTSAHLTHCLARSQLSHCTQLSNHAQLVPLYFIVKQRCLLCDSVHCLSQAAHILCVHAGHADTTIASHVDGEIGCQGVHHLSSHATAGERSKKDIRMRASTACCANPCIRLHMPQVTKSCCDCFYVALLFLCNIIMLITP